MFSSLDPQALYNAVLHSLMPEFSILVYAYIVVYFVELMLDMVLHFVYIRSDGK